MDAVVMAAGRLPAAEAARYGTDVKALVRIGGSTTLQSMLAALRSAARIAMIIVVGPGRVKDAAAGADVWIEERSSGEENALAGLERASRAHTLLAASDLPFVRAQHVDGFLELVNHGADVAYPIYERTEFLAAFPAGRSRFAHVGKHDWTGGSVCLINTELAQHHSRLIRKGFRARKNPLALASLLGPGLLLRYVAGRIEVADVERRLGDLIGGSARAVRHAHPALAMDCDDSTDIEYARVLAQEHDAAVQPGR